MSVASIFGDRPRNRETESLRDARIDFMQRRRRVAGVLASQLRQSKAAEGPLAGDQFVNDHAETVDVRAAVDFCISVVRQIAPLLRRHVIRRAQHLPGNREIRASCRFRSGDFA